MRIKAAYWSSGMCYKQNSAKKPIQNPFLFSHKSFLYFNSNDLIYIYLTLCKCDYPGKNSNKNILDKVEKHSY